MTAPPGDDGLVRRPSTTRPHGVTIEVLDVVHPSVGSAVLDLAADAEVFDGVAPLSEAVLLRLHHPERHATHLVARDGTGRMVGYLAQVPGGGDPPVEVVAEAVVHPDSRRRGIGTRLFDQALAVATAAERWTMFRAWAHGDLPAAARLADNVGMKRDRILLRMRWAAEGKLPTVVEPAGIEIRTFRPGDDDQAWVALNARAFAGHPEQAYVGLGDLHDRMDEEWFDPAGFFLAERESDGELVGFHWTKVHARPEHVGEVYVIGIDPSARGTGLGLALTVTGLAHLVARGLPAVILFADETNTGAVRLYERLGFQRDQVHIEYAREITR